jgi:L,D-transpeptidase ErfK/SrfK
MLQRQGNHNDIVCRSFMLMSFAAAILLLSVRWQVKSPEAVLPEQVGDAKNLATASPDPIPSPLAVRYPSIAIRRDRPRLIVDLSDRQVSLYKRDELVERYPVAIGQAGWETPTGTFHVTEMEVNPSWEHPITGELIPAGADNPLGSRWIGFWSDGTNQIGFHGTNEADSVGQAVSHGCVRLHNADIQKMYAQVGIGTTVTVRP